MAINVSFNVVSEHEIIRVDAGIERGLVKARPAFPQQSRLYVIHNASTDRPIYVGTAGSVQNRFDPRLSASRELGFSNADLGPIRVYVIQILVDGISRTPGDNGVSNGIDVEHLLIRTYLIPWDVSVRNITKTGAFTNNTGQRLNWELVLNGIACPHGANRSFYLNNGGAF